MQASSIELVVRGVRMPKESGRTASVVVGPCNRSDVHLLSLNVGAGDAHALQHELQGEQTIRKGALCLVGRIAEAMGGEVVAAHLEMPQPGLVTGMLEVQTPGGKLQVRAEPGQALSAAVCLGVPLLADSRLFVPRADPEPLGGQLESFLASLDLSDLGEDGA